MRGGVGLHEGAAAGFDVEDQAVEIFGQFFAHDAGGDEVGGLDGAGVVAEAVEDAVGGNEGGGLASHGEVTLGQDAGEVGYGELGGEAGDGLELVEGAAGVTEAAAGDHRVDQAGGGCDGGYEERCFMPRPPSGVFVYAEGCGSCG